MFAGGKGGALLGTGASLILSESFSKIGRDVDERYLSNRERERIGAILAFAGYKIKHNIDQGQKVRNDKFMKTSGRHRSDAEEIIEGILIAAQREHEEKKLIYYGTLLANLAFHPEIDGAQANVLLNVAERVTYRQLCIIAMFMNPSEFGLRQTDYREGGVSGNSRVALFQEIYNLYTEGMLHCSANALLGLGDINPNMMRTQGVGVILYTLMELHRLSKYDLEKVAQYMK